MSRVSRYAGLSAVPLFVAFSALAQPPAASPLPDQASAETIAYGEDRADRMTVPVNIDGRGPYRFVVDTGAERTVISSELARDLNLAPGGEAVVHSVTEVSRIPTVVVPGLEVGERRIGEIRAPALSGTHLGAVGMLGVDSLQHQRVDFDFARREMTISPSRVEQERWPSDTIVVRARSRFGRLMLVDATLNGERVYVIVDTGSQYTIGNNALRRRLERRERLGPLRQVEFVSVTGGRLIADFGIARRLRVGGVEISDLAVAFADAHVFRQLGLENRPAILLGMDALQLFDRVSVDFANRRVRVVLPESSSFDPPTRMASRAASRAP